MKIRLLIIFSIFMPSIIMACLTEKMINSQVVGYVKAVSLYNQTMDSNKQDFVFENVCEKIYQFISKIVDNNQIILAVAKESIAKDLSCRIMKTIHNNCNDAWKNQDIQNLVQNKLLNRMLYVDLITQTTQEVLEQSTYGQPVIIFNCTSCDNIKPDTKNLFSRLNEALQSKLNLIQQKPLLRRQQEVFQEESTCLKTILQQEIEEFHKLKRDKKTNVQLIKNQQLFRNKFEIAEAKSRHNIDDRWVQELAVLKKIQALPKHCGRLSTTFTQTADQLEKIYDAAVINVVRQSYDLQLQELRKQIGKLQKPQTRTVHNSMQTETPDDSETNSAGSVATRSSQSLETVHSSAQTDNAPSIGSGSRTSVVSTRTNNPYNSLGMFGQPF